MKAGCSLIYPKNGSGCLIRLSGNRTKDQGEEESDKDEACREDIGQGKTPCKVPDRGGQKRPDEAAFWKSFSADEVRAYSKALGDHNEIHYTEKPVVSGFQIFESVMEEYPSDGMKISFHHPVFSGEEVYLMEKDQKIEGYTDQLCFVAVRS